MTQLIATIGVGKGTWNEVQSVVQSEQWSEVIIITNEFGKEKFSANEHTTFVIVNEEQSLETLTKDIEAQMKEKVKDLEVGVTIISGTGKMHTAVLQALMNNGVGFRFVN